MFTRLPARSSQHSREELLIGNSLIIVCNLQRAWRRPVGGWRGWLVWWSGWTNDELTELGRGRGSLSGTVFKLYGWMDGWMDGE